MRIKRYRKCLIITAVVASLFCSGMIGNEYLFYKEPDNISADTVDIQDDMVLLGGMPVGIYLETNGVMVIGTQGIEDMDGIKQEPAAHIVKSGDYITAINQTPIENKKNLLSAINDLDDSEVVLHLRRNSKQIDVKIHPVKTTDGSYKLGIWVRDNMQGLGTVTYMDEDHHFAALGHGIHDIDTNTLLEIQEGILYKTNIKSISKGKVGSPGSMEGIIIYSSFNELGNISRNNETGIYGTIKKTEEMFENQVPIQIASKDEIEIGKATIRCKVTDKIEDYHINIIDIDYSGHEINKGMIIEITDSKLLDITGGIVQGMSGSPIIQNGKLIGAVTHVFIKDSTKGYGIFIENMLESSF